MIFYHYPFFKVFISSSWITACFVLRIYTRSLHLCANMQIVKEVLKLNEDPGVHGLYLHLPQASLTSRVLTALKPEKDVDG